jgi:hypothetical protein
MSTGSKRVDEDSREVAGRVDRRNRESRVGSAERVSKPATRGTEFIVYIFKSQPISADRFKKLSATGKAAPSPADCFHLMPSYQHVTRNYSTPPSLAAPEPLNCISNSSAGDPWKPAMPLPP